MAGQQMMRQNRHNGGAGIAQNYAALGQKAAAPKGRASAIAIEVGPKFAGRFVAKVPGQPGVITIGETAVQAQMRAAVAALRVKVFGADDANDRAAAQQ